MYDDIIIRTSAVIKLNPYNCHTQ